MLYLHSNVISGHREQKSIRGLIPVRSNISKILKFIMVLSLSMSWSVVSIPQIHAETANLKSFKNCMHGCRQARKSCSGGYKKCNAQFNSCAASCQSILQYAGRDNARRPIVETEIEYQHTD